MPTLDQAEAFVITVLDGPLSSTVLMAGEAPGVVALQGRSLPYRPISFAGRQRVKTRYYAGNTVATQQVTGPVEEPTTVSGFWKDRFLGDGVAMGLILLFDQIRRTGPQLQVAWGGFVRTGVLQQFKATPDNTQDIAWEAVFEWASQGEQVAPLISATPASNPREGLRAVFDDSTAVVDSLGSFLQTAPARIVGFSDQVTDKLDSATNAVLEQVDLLNGIVDAVTTVADLPREVVERGITLSRAIAASLRNVEEGLLDPLLELASPSESGVWVGAKALVYNVKDDPLGLLVYLDEKLQVLRNVGAALETCLNTADELEAQLYPTVIAEERPPAGTDLRDLAIKHYGDADLWWIIAQFNGLDTSAVPALPTEPSDNPARTIKIPRRSTGALADLRKAC
jgi:hypothetical protein